MSHEIDVALRELALEEVRREKYSQYPSRMASLHVSRTYDEAERWGQYFARLGRLTYGIAKIRKFFTQKIKETLPRNAIINIQRCRSIPVILKKQICKK